MRLGEKEGMPLGRPEKRASGPNEKIEFCVQQLLNPRMAVKKKRQLKNQRKNTAVAKKKSKFVFALCKSGGGLPEKVGLKKS